MQNNGQNNHKNDVIILKTYKQTKSCFIIEREYNKKSIIVTIMKKGAIKTFKGINGLHIPYRLTYPY